MKPRYLAVRITLLFSLSCFLMGAAVWGGRVINAEPPLTFFRRGVVGGDIVLLDVAHAHLHFLTRQVATERDPVWSPNGERLAFISDLGGQAQLYLWEMGAGSDLQPLVPSRVAPGYHPVWSPDSRYLAVEFFRGIVGIYVVDTACVRENPPCSIRRLSDSQTDERFPVWSPQGDRIAYVSWRDGNAEIYSAHPDGSDLRNLTRDAGWDVSPSWSPDGTQLAFFSDRDRYRELYVMDADGGNLRKLTDDNNPENAQASGAAVWSPDGRWLSYGFAFEGNFDVMLIPADCADGQTNVVRCRELMHRVAPSATSDLAPFWSPDGRWLQFLSDRQGQLAIYRADPQCARCSAWMLTDGYSTSVQASWRPTYSPPR